MLILLYKTLIENQYAAKRLRESMNDWARKSPRIELRLEFCCTKERGTKDVPNENPEFVKRRCATRSKCDLIM